jgi:predicted hydrocarbon binding protein
MAAAPGRRKTLRQPWAHVHLIIVQKEKPQMFKEERNEPLFEWAMLGQIDSGRPNLGFTTHVAVYRLMQFTLRDVLIRQHGVAAADRVFYAAGELAGKHFYENLITKRNSFAEFVAELQDVLREMGVGILRIEKGDVDNLTFTLTVAEDLDCSGLPACDEQICTYDEGFISGLLSAHTGKKFSVKEVDCWCSGDRVCRFEVKPVS